MDQYNIANRETFIASSFFTTFINEAGGTLWHNIGRFFRNNIAANRGDGLYIIPSFFGGDDCGHWIVNMILIQNGRARGFALDSLGTHYNPNKSLVRRRIMEGFNINSLLDWLDIPILLQTELECGSRCIWNMTILCLGRKHHIDLNTILNTIKTMGNIPRKDSAQTVREDVYNIIASQSASDLFNRLFPQFHH